MSGDAPPTNPEVVAITWDDAVHHEGVYTAPDLEGLDRPAAVTTVGYLLRQTDNGYLIAAELHDYPFQQQWSGVSFIPRGMVRGVQRLEGRPVER